MRRAAAAALLVVAALGACGDDDPGLEAGDAVPTSQPERTATTSLADAPAPTRVGESLEAELVGESRVPAGPHTWTIELTNTTDAELVVTFPTSQRGDAVVAREGEVVHRWSSEKFFQQQVTELPIAAGATEIIELQDDLSAVEPGFYDVTITVAVVGPPEPIERSIRVVSP